ncbi:MAG: thioredoxin family protein [Bacteroidetes bacterium]|nr:thioredoxin family protein [Bacteroidota bacterium]
MPEAPSPLTVSHPHPPTAGADLSAKWAQGITFEEFLPTAKDNIGLWEGVYKRAAIPADILERARKLPGNWRLLILSADWCGDASNIVPVIQRLVEAAPNLDLRLLDRDDHLDLMDEHLTGGTAQAIPAVIILDQNNTERAWWGPRPAELQTWVKTEGQAYSKNERYKEVRKWYARDKGRSSLDEVVALLELASAAG